MKMKKNITINLFGALYAIDEDACELLNQYQKNMRRYFSRKEGGEEIAEDIERRVAELFAELKASGVEAITMEHVQDIIARIGNPEEVDGEEAVETPGGGAGTEKEKIRKKLFRDPDDKLLGGVASGLACYLGADSLWIRLLWILLTWLSGGVVIVVYLALCLIVPEAGTPEDRLRMQGRAVNMKNLRDEIVNGAQKMGRYATAPETKRTAKGCLNGLFEIFAVLLKGCLALVGCGFLLLCAVALVGVVVALCVCYMAYLDGSFVSEITGESFVYDFIAGRIDRGIYWFVLASFLFWLSLTLYTGIHSMMRAAGRVQPMTAQKRTMLAVLWLVAAIACVSSLFSGGMSYEHYRQECRAREDSMRMQRQLDYLESEGWRVVRHEHCYNYVNSGEYYTGDHVTRYIDTWSRDPNMAYELERTVRVAPGTYRLEAAARTDGHGCVLFAATREGRRQADVPVCGNTGGGIWQEARRKRKEGGIMPGLWRNIAGANAGKGYGWSRVAVEGIVVGADSVVRYGVSNARGKRWDGTWFSATDFDLEKMAAK